MSIISVNSSILSTDLLSHSSSSSSSTDVSGEKICRAVGQIFPLKEFPFKTENKDVQCYIDLCTDIPDGVGQCLFFATPNGYTSTLLDTLVDEYGSNSKCYHKGHWDIHGKYYQTGIDNGSGRGREPIKSAITGVIIDKATNLCCSERLTLDVI